MLSTPFVVCLAVAGRTVTIRNDVPRLDVNGNYIDAFDGKIVHYNGTYFLYGEAYGNQTLATPYPWKKWPRLKVYTSPNLVDWTFAADPLPMVEGTLWIPNVVYHEPTRRFIMWYGSGGWASATSADGIHFTPAAGPFVSRFAKGGTDGTGIMIDDDGTGYVAFAANPPGFDEPGHPHWPGHTAHGYGHIVSIERMSPDLLRSSKVNVTGFFPDDYVESPSLFKRKGLYYLTYGSCCCGCAEGGGQVVFTAKAVEGPWVRQTHADINCNNATAKCCYYPDSDGLMGTHPPLVSESHMGDIFSLYCSSAGVGSRVQTFPLAAETSAGTGVMPRLVRPGALRWADPPDGTDSEFQP